MAQDAVGPESLVSLFAVVRTLVGLYDSFCFESRTAYEPTSPYKIECGCCGLRTFRLAMGPNRQGWKPPLLLRDDDGRRSSMMNMLHVPRYRTTRHVAGKEEEVCY